MKTVWGLVLGVFLALLTSGEVGAQSQVAASLSGDARIDGFTLNFTVDAERSDSGVVAGGPYFTSTSGNETCGGKATELVSPFGARDFWCVGFLMTDSVCFPVGHKVLVFIRDVPGGPDEFSFVDDRTGACNDFDDSPRDWQSVTSGDFVGVEEDLCAEEKAALAECEAQKAALESDLGDCEARAASCESDLDTCYMEHDQCSADLAACQSQLGCIPPREIPYRICRP